MKSWFQIGTTTLLCVALASSSCAQQASHPDRFTLQQAVEFARAHFPETGASLAKVMAARAEVGLARTAFLPRTDLLWQTNRATYNNIAGLLLPQAALPSLSGPVLLNSSGQTLWGSAGGALLSWQPFDFGLRSANVNVARRAESGANFQLQLTQLDVSAAAADAFLAVVVEQQTLRASEADVDRRVAFSKAVHALVDNQLRPGADASRADAELAAARTQWLRMQEAEENGRVALAEALGIAGASIQVNPGSLSISLPGEPTMPAQAVPADHPLAELAMSAVDESRARERALKSSYFPAFNFQSAIAGRGSAFKPNGNILGGSNGLVPDRYNFAVGVTASFPVFDYFSVRLRKQFEAASEQGAEAEYDKTIQHLTAQFQRAQTALKAAQQIAENTELELRSAKMSDSQAEARYRASLANVVDVADAQRLLVQAETDDAVAKVSVWRALLAESFAQGNLQPFLDAVTKAGGGN